MISDTNITAATASNRESTSTVPGDDVVDDGNVESPRRNEDMDNVIRELTLAVMKSKNVSTLTRAFKSAQKVQPADENLFSETGLIFVKEKLSSRSSSSSATTVTTTGRLRSSFRALKSRSSQSVDAMKDLWKQTGMKTNGRKLLAVDNDDVDAITRDDRRHSHRRRRRKRACRVHRRVHATSSNATSSSSSSQSSRSPKFSSRSNSDACSDSSPPYVGVASQKKPLAYSSSTEVYAEVYDEENEMRKISGVRTKSSSASSYRRYLNNQLKALSRYSKYS